MPKTKAISPARSQGDVTTPKRKTTRSSRSLCSPALSTASGRLTSLIDQFKDKNMESFALSPLNSRSVLNDNTEIEEPRRKSWWKKLDENSQDVMEVLEDNKLTNVNNIIEEFIDIEVLSQERKNYTLDLPESSDNESINSIVLPQRKLFTQKENQPQKKYGHLIDNRESLAKLHKTNTTNIDKTVNVGTRELFQNTKRSKPIFPAALLNISPNKTAADKTKENMLLEPKPQVRNIFGNRPANKRKNMFTDFIASESEDEIPDIQPKVFGFQKRIEQRRFSSVSKGRDASPASSITTDIEMDFRMLLPSSTMVENQLEENMLQGTPIKRARLSKLSEAKESEAGTITLQTNASSDKTKHSNKSVSSKNKTKASPEIRDKIALDRSLNSSRTTRSMLKNASKRDENVNTSVKQDTNSNKSPSEISPKGNQLINVSPSTSDEDTQNATVNKSQKQNKSKTRDSPKVIENEIESEETVVNAISNVTRVINKSTNKSLPNTTATNKSVNEKERTVTIKEHKPGPNDEEQDEQEEDENNFSLQYDDENEMIEEAEVHNALHVNQTDNIKKHNTVVLEKEIQETEINKSKSNKSSLTNKSMQKEPIPAKIVEESVESQTEQYSADDNVDGNVEQEPEVVNQKIHDDVNKSRGVRNEEKKQENEMNISQEHEAEANASEDNEDKVNVSHENEDEHNESQKEVANESQHVENEEIEGEQEGTDSDENEHLANESQEVEAEVNESQEIDEEADESQEVEAEVNESQEIEEEADESKEVEAEVNENQEIEEEPDESQEVEAEVNESQEIEEEADESKEVEAEVNENQEIEEEPDESQDVEAEVNESQEIEEEADESQEVDTEVNESQEIEEKADDSQEIEEEANQSQEIDEEANESQEIDEEANARPGIYEEAHKTQVIDTEAIKRQENVEEIIEDNNAPNEDSDEQMNEDDEEAANESEAKETSANESQDIENEEEESEAEVNQSEEIEDDQQMDDSDEADKAIATDPEISDTDDNQPDEMEVDDDEEESENTDESEQNQDESHAENQNEEQNEIQPSTEEIEESPNVTHDTTGRHRKKNFNKSPEVILHDKTNDMDSFTAKGRNTSVRKTKSMIKNLNLKPSLVPPRNSTGFSDGTTNSSAEGSGWDSHRTTRKTLRQTFGKDFTPRKSLRALVMEKSAKRQTEQIAMHSETVKFPLANSTEMPEDSNHYVEDIVESDHELSRRTRQTTLEMYLEKMKEQNIEKKLKMEQAVRNSLKSPVGDPLSLFKVPNKPAPRRPKPAQSKTKKQIKSIIPFDELPSEVIEDMKYKPPKRFQPTNASWITKRLYKFLENKLEPKYDYKARVRAEKLVETIYHFAKDLRRHDAAPSDAVEVLKHELARLEVVRTHFEFYEFFHEFMPREIRVKVVPDIVNKIALPRHGVFSDILRGNTVQG